MAKNQRPQLRQYQKDARDDLVKFADKYVQRDNKRILFEAPTGSGKTVVMGEFLRKWVDKPSSENLSFVWLAPLKLHTQSKEKLEEQLHDSVITCSYYDDLDENMIKQNEIFFEHWESISSKDINKKIRKKESGKYLKNICKNTKKEGRKIVLILDEGHRNVSAKGARAAQLDIDPDLTIFVTATPDEEIPYDKEIDVDVDDVVEEEMIKRNILTNPNWLDKKKRQKVTNESVIAQGLKKREELKKLYKKNKISGRKTVNPLLVIQIPRKGGNESNVALQANIEKFLKKQKITYENGKLALYLDKEKKNLDQYTGLAIDKQIEDNNNEVEVLIFKEAVGIGWDCPRAHILLLFRQHKERTFGFQTIGRIMRMPDLKYYDADALNSGYIYTNLPPFDLEKQYADFYVSLNSSTLQTNLYKPIKLSSIHIKRQREGRRLNSKFGELFRKNKEIKKKMKSLSTKKVAKITYQIISNATLTPTYYNQSGKIIQGSKNAISLSTDDEIGELFERQLRIWCGNKEKERSHGIIRTTLYKSLKEDCKIDHMIDNEKAIRIILADKNSEIISQCIKITLEKYDKYYKKQKPPEKIKTNPFEILSIHPIYGDPNELQPRAISKSVVKPLYEGIFDSTIEKLFAKKLNSSKNVVWWYKNGKNTSGFFGVEWADTNNEPHMFYPDWIVQWKDGTIGIYDTKLGNTVSDNGETKPKAKALNSHIKKENPKRVRKQLKFNSKIQKLVGGIISNTKANCSGLWKINKNAKQQFEENKLDTWDNLTI